MSAVEVCAICDIAGCHHIRDRADLARQERDAAVAAALGAAENIARIRAEQHAEMVISGDPHASRKREAMEAAFNDMRWAIRALITPSAKSALDAQIEAAVAAERARLEPLRKAAEPFRLMSGELFARNWNASDVVLALDNPGEPHRLIFNDFLELHTTLAAIGGPK